uniref:Snf2-related CREBBP activator protein n=1 Tax=Scleropages formosus TaxID=113540 RepID=A0A8C9VXF1_SCLFO
APAQPTTGDKEMQVVHTEAEIEHRTLALKREGFWSLKRISRVTEPVRPKVHWDYLCEEMQWLSADFAQERRWKRGVARKLVRMVMRHHEEQRQKEEKIKREEQAKLRRVASSIAKEVRAFWSNVEKVVQFKQQSRLEEKRKKALDLHLDFIVGQTERYSDLLSQSLGDPGVPVSVSSRALLHPETAATALKGPQQYLTDEDDGDFEPLYEEDDDEETIEVEEQQEGNDAETHKREIELLRQEGSLPLEQLLQTLTHAQVLHGAHRWPLTCLLFMVCCHAENLKSNRQLLQSDFWYLTTSLPSTAKDEEETIEAQEIVEGDTDHSEELGDLAREGRLCGVSAVLYLVACASACVFQLPVVVYLITSEVDFRFFGKFWFIHRPTIFHLFSDSSGEVDSGEAGEGMEVLLKGGDYSPPGPTISRPKKEISHIAATAESLQPKGYTLATTQVKTPIPFLLHGTLREYQHIGLDWLVTMYEKKLNGILADEMGLGKTIQTIALLAHLACEKGNWGPHLIIVPTSVMLNWEMELKRWCPSFKILTYYGSQKERKLKRQGWTKPNAFHVCITSYKLVLQDHQAFRRKSWRYLILDEAQNIKNFKSQRWQSLLNFNSQRRLLLTGTPLQNSLMELWSLMHFLMPHVFQSHREFKEWFSNPLTGMIEGSQEYNEGLVKRLHKVLRPFLLRRIKADVEKQMPKKYEHVVRCRLSKRQRFLYDDFMAQASTRETLASGHFMSVINILMQLRKVCNHPNLFDPRPIQSPFITAPIVFSTASLVLQALDTAPFERCDLSMFDLVGLEGRVSRYQADIFVPRRKVTAQLVQEIMDSPDPLPRPKPVRMKVNRMFQPLPKAEGRTMVLVNSPCPATTGPASFPGPRPPVGPDGAVPSATHLLAAAQGWYSVPSGEVVSIAQLASLAGRPVSSQGSKPVTFQLQGNKLTLSGAPLHQGAAPQHRPIQGFSCLQCVCEPFPSDSEGSCSTIMSSNGIVSFKQTAPSGNEDSSDVITVRMPAAPSPSLLSGGPSSLRVRPQPPPPPRSPFYMSWLENKRKCQREERLSRILQVNERHCSAKPVYGCEVLDFLTFLPKPILSPVQTFPGDWARLSHPEAYWVQSKTLREAIHTTEERLQLLRDVIERFIFVIPPVEAPPISMHTCHPPPSMAHQQAMLSSTMSSKFAPFFRCLHRIQCNMRTHFPDLRLIQYDCGKLQTLHSLLRRLKTGGHRVLIFTQMTRMLDVLEQFLNYHGHIYLRLDGSTRVEQRQALMERFNADQRIFCFILSTRSGGVGVNLTGADTVVFYDSDWNPTMDAQAQDRCHRIGQTRDVHIYRLISERTVEENILKKANQKRMLGDMAIEGGNFTTAFFKQQTIRELFDVSEGDKKEEPNLPIQVEEDDPFNKQQTTILEQALCRAEDEEDIVAASQAKAEQVAELAEFNESIPLEEGSEGMGREQEEEELSKAEQEIAALVEQLTPIERYAMNFLEASLEDVCKEELKQAEEQVEAARKGLDQAKEEGLKLPTPSDNEDEEFLLSPGDSLPVTAVRRPRKHKEKGAPSTRVSGRLRGAVVTPDMDLASIERFREQGPESQNLERDLTSTNLTHSLPTPHCHKTTPVTVVPKQDLLTLPLPTEGDVSKSVCCVHDTEGTKEVAVPVANSPSGKDSRNSQIHNQLCSSSPATDKCANPAEVSSVPSASELGSGAHSATSSLPESTLIPPVALSPVAKKIQITHAQCALSTSHSFSEGESKDQAQSDSGRVPTDTVSQTQLELTTKKDAKLEESLSAGSEVGNICKIQSDSTQRQNSDSVTPTKDQDEQIQKSLKSPNSVQPALARSPRKRQSADGEVLSSHTDDSPSAKVLRKLPGRLVTVVEDKEPRRKKRAAGGGEEIRLTEMEQSEDGKASHMHDTAGTAKKENKSDPEAFPTTHFLVLRRRLETESRMAAQLGDQHLGRWRGKGGERKTSSSPNFLRKLGTKLEADEETVTPELNTTPLGKRKRGRPPKTPPRVAKSQTERTSPCKAESTSTSERNPSPSPKRKRGRPPLTSSPGSPELSQLPSRTVPGVIAQCCGTERGLQSPFSSSDELPQSSLDAAISPASRSDQN